MKEKNIILAARTISIVFTPFYLPVLGLVALFMLSYLDRLVPWYYKLIVIMMVYLFTVLLPTLLIHLYRKYQGWTLHELGMKERRIVPYIISIVCYFACYYTMNLYHIPRFISSILITTLAIQIICALIDVWWKISTHSAVIGGVTGALMSLVLLFHLNPTWWLCLAILFAGLVGPGRIILKQHTLSQANVGFIVGLISAFYIISII